LGVSARRRFDISQLRITRGALVIAGLELGLSLVWLVCDNATKATIADWVIATPHNVFERGRVWTLVTSNFLEPQFIGLILHMVVLWSFVPTLERFWGTARFYRFVAVTAIAGTLVGTTAGYLLGHLDPIGYGPEAITGLSSVIYASIVAFGIVYARQPVQFWGVLPLTGRQLMYGFLAFLALFVLLQGFWEQGAAFAAAMIAAAIMTSKRWSPGLAWKRWRIARARAKLTVVQGGAGKPRDEHKWLN
jgi:membrane associated rhomboid family serine protease